MLLCEPECVSNFLGSHWVAVFLARSPEYWCKPNFDDATVAVQMNMRWLAEVVAEELDLELACVWDSNGRRTRGTAHVLQSIANGARCQARFIFRISVIADLCVDGPGAPMPRRAERSKDF